MTLRLDNIAPVSDDKRSLLTSFGIVTNAPAFIVRPAPLTDDKRAEIYPSLDRLSTARTMLRNGATNADVIAKTGLALPQVASLRSHIERRY